MNIMTTNNIKKQIIKISVIALILACKRNELSPGLEYMPDMYRHPSVQSYEVVSDTVGMRPLPPGVITKTSIYMPYSNTPEDYEKAAEMKNPLPLNDSILQIGEFYFSKFCTPCHGQKGESDGNVVTIGGFPPPPNKFSSQYMKELPEGKMFFVITYGKNLMPPYSYQIPPEKRWAIIHYIKHKLINPS